MEKLSIFPNDGMLIEIQFENHLWRNNVGNGVDLAVLVDRKSEFVVSVLPSIKFYQKVI